MPQKALRGWSQGRSWSRQVIRVAILGNLSPKEMSGAQCQVTWHAAPMRAGAPEMGGAGVVALDRKKSVQIRVTPTLSMKLSLSVKSTPPLGQCLLGLDGGHNGSEKGSYCRFIDFCITQLQVRE